MRYAIGDCVQDRFEIRELLGVGASAEAYRALDRNAGHDVVLKVPHLTIAGDLVEATALGKVFGTHRPAVYAPKAALGNTFGAAGAIEAVLTVQALRDGVVPPTLNLKSLDERINLDVVTGQPRKADYRYALSNTFAFGGHNVVLAFGKY